MSEGVGILYVGLDYHGQYLRAMDKAGGGQS